MMDKRRFTLRARIYGAFTVLLIVMVITEMLSATYYYRNQLMGYWIFSLCVTIFTLAVGIFSEIYLTRAIVTPIKEIRKNIDLVKLGHVDVEAKKVSNDEIGDVADDLNEMIASIKKQADIVEEIASGNLMVDVVPRSQQDVLSYALLDLINKNNDVLSNIKESTMQVTVGAGQVADASQALAQGSTEQASAIEEITASMDDIADKTKANAEQATAADAIVHEVRDGAERGNNQMQDMMVAMKEINEASEKISKVIKVIDDIAFQTNILALNATVEAARAGVHGKGFAVVAEEVRNLAEKSAAAAKETSDMIQDSISKVKTGSELAGDTSKALKDIVESIVKVVELIDSIADASNQQATAVTQINQAISQVSQVIQTNSATSEECASASEELSNQAQNLRNLLGSYQLKEITYRSAGISMPRGNGHFTGGYSGNDNEKIISLDGGFGKY